MSQNFSDYVRELWDTLFLGKETEANYDSERKKLEEYLSGIGGLPTTEKLPDAPKYERQEAESLSDEEIRARAEAGLHDYYTSSVKAIDSNSEENAKRYESDKITAQKTAEQKAAALEEAYAKARENSSNDSLKRGLARSSIALNQQHSLSESEAKAAASVNNELSDAIAQIDSELNALTAKRESALNDFNIAYAAKLTTSINELKDKLDAKKTEALKYNNTLTEKEFSAQVSKAEKESDLYSKSLSQKEKENELATSNSLEQNDNKYETMRAMLLKLPLVQAREVILNDPIFKDNLSDYHYYKLYTEFCRYS